MSVPVAASILICFLAPFLCAFSWYRRAPSFPFLLVFSAAVLGQHLFLVAFASVFGNYGLSLGAAAVLLFVVSFLARRLYPRQEPAKGDFISNVAPVALFACVFAGYLFIRSHYPFIAFINSADEVGVEKLFNLSLHQSFLFGSGWPVEWIWLGGEPVRYYVFLKSIPGILSWLARALFGDPSTGGVFFILSEAAIAAFTPALMCAWLLWFLKSSPSAGRVLMSVLIPLTGLLCAHYKSISLGLKALAAGNSLEWWQLAEVIRFTNSQYPVWLMMLGDNHAYSQAYPLQVLLWGGVLCLVLEEERSYFLSFCAAVTGCALLLTHPGSVLVDLSTLAPFSVLALALKFRAEGKAGALVTAKNLVAAALFAVPFAALLYQPTGNIKVVFPELRLATTFSEFLSQNFFILVLSSLAAVFSVKRSRISPAWIISVALGAVAAQTLFHRPAVSITILCGGLLGLIAAKANRENGAIFGLFVFSAFLMLIPPEFIAFDHTMDNRTDWIRFQMSLRFFSESFTLIPFALGVSFGRPLAEAARSSRAVSLLFFGILSLFILLAGISHYPAVENRISRTRQLRTLDGFDEFYRRYPGDTGIIEYLRGIPSDRTLMIGELCSADGSGSIPAHYGWPGRISAYSGRRGLCGWGRHAALFNNPLTAEGFRLMSVQAKVGMFNTIYRRVLSGGAGKGEIITQMDRRALSDLGVTHLVFGEWERKMFPAASLNDVARTTGGKVVLENGDGTGIVEIGGGR